MDIRRSLSWNNMWLVCFVVLISGNSFARAGGPLGFIRDLLQNNIAGAPIVHRVTTWDFDPEVAERRRDQYYELNGYRGEKLIERLGLGIDGYAAQRLVQQQARDAGKLGGVLAQQPTDQI